MMHVLCHSGREAYAVQYASENVEVVENRAVARTIAFAGDAAHAEVVARAARVTADANRSGPWAATFAVQALCMEGRFDEAVERAQGDARGLARCVEWTIDHRARLDLAHRAIELAPEDRTALAAWHAVLMDAGRVDEARNAAHVLMDNFPYEHQAAERLAEVELFAGDVDAAVTWAQTAVAEDPQCARALAALTMASVAAGDWEAAKTALLRYGAVSRPLRLFADAEPVGLVDAAIGRDREVYERRLAAVRKVAPGLPLDRITSACEERFNEAEKP